jgi:hypothetical protein
VAAAAAVSEAVKVAAPFLLGASCSPGHGGEQMLSFSSSASSCSSGGGGAAVAAAAAAGGAMPLYYGTPASCSGLSSVSLSSSMQGAMARVRGPFTPSQWIELEHQALIYKYLAANSPVPHSLLIPIRRSLTSPYSPAYFGSSTCKPRNGKGSRSTECFLGFSSFHHGLIFMIKAVPFPDLGCIALGWVFALQWDGDLSSWATPAARIRSPAGAAGRTARNGGARGMRSPTRSTVSDT